MATSVDFELLRGHIKLYSPLLNRVEFQVTLVTGQGNFGPGHVCYHVKYELRRSTADAKRKSSFFPSSLNSKSRPDLKSTAHNDLNINVPRAGEVSEDFSPR